jgi:RNA polymerase sigma factor (sigma-70 family)
MPRPVLRPFVHRLRHSLAGRAAANVSDTELLECFCRDRDEASFELLVRRHEGLVLGVCRRVLRDRQVVEDAFQATFLALVRKAASVGRRGSVAGWLYRVAYHTAVRAGQAAVRRAGREQQGLDVSRAAARDDPVAEAAARELGPLLDAELSRLPAKYRDPMVLCYLEGKTHDEVGRQLGCPKGTVATRLARARGLLRARLEGRGVLLGSSVLAAGLAATTVSAASPRLVEATLALTRAPGVVGSALAPHVVALTEGVLRTMWLTKIRLAVVLVLSIGLLGLGAGALALPAPSDQPELPPAAPRSVAGGNQVGEVHCLVGHTAAVERVAFSPDGRLLLSCSLDATIRLWDVASGQKIRRFLGHADRVDCVSFHPDGKTFLSASWDGTIRLWDVATGKEIRRIRFQGEPGVHVSGVWWFPDGRHCLALATDHHSLQIYDVQTGRLLKDFGRHPGHIYAAALAPTGRYVVEGSYDASAPVRVWDVASGKLVQEFKKFRDRTHGVAVSPDGRLALTTGQAPALRLWDVQTGQLVRLLKGHATGASGVAFSPDGRRALSAGSDHTVRLWHVATGAEEVRFFGHLGGVACVAFAPDGRYAASGGDDKTVRIWRLPAPVGAPLKALHAYGQGRSAPDTEEEPGEKEWRLAEFYRRTGHAGSAYYYYERLVRRHRSSAHVQEAMDRMDVLRRQLEQALDDFGKAPKATGP